MCIIINMNSVLGRTKWKETHTKESMFKMFYIYGFVRWTMWILWAIESNCTVQKMKFSITDLFSKCDQIRRKLPIWSHIYWRNPWRKTSFLCSVACSFKSFFEFAFKCIPAFRNKAELSSAQKSSMHYCNCWWENST